VLNEGQVCVCEEADIHGCGKDEGSWSCLGVW
jgi:hypothetical protein